MLLTGHYNAIHLWEVATGELRWKLNAGARALALTPDQGTLYSGSLDSGLIVWDVRRFGLQGLPGAEKPTPAELQTLWTDLAGNTRVAFIAQQRLAAAPKEAVPFLAERLGRQPANIKRLNELVASLDSANFATRESAAAELEKLGPLAETRLLDALAAKPEAELRRRIEDLLRKLEPSPDRLRDLRAVESLERIGNEESLRALVDLAKHTPRLGEQAIESAARLRLLAGKK
jgi:hypothetical protein